MKLEAERISLADRLDRLIRGSTSVERTTTLRAERVAVRQTEAILAMASHVNSEPAAADSVEPVPPVPATVSSGEGLSLARPDEPGMSLRVLVAEADALHRQVLVRLVRNLGYTVDAASSAEE